jgi:hypothetical protein
MYDHWLPDRRRRITTNTYKSFLNNINQFTRPRLFTKDGEEVEIVNIEDPEVLPVLWNLKRLKEEFVGEDVEMVPEDAEPYGISYDRSKTTKCYVYPLCFTGNFGNFQSHGPMHCMLGHIDAINRSLSGPGLTAGGMQGYLRDAHDYRAGGAKNQESTKTAVTGFIGGVYRRGAVAESKYRALKRDLEVDLPHARFAKTVAETQPKFRCQRVENVWHISLDKLAPEDQNTEYFNTNFCHFILTYALYSGTSTPLLKKRLG